MLMQFLITQSEYFLRAAASGVLIKPLSRRIAKRVVTRALLCLFTGGLSLVVVSF